MLSFLFLELCFVIEDGFQLTAVVARIFLHCMSSPMSSMLPRYLYNLHSLFVLFIMYYSVLSWFTLRSLGFSISGVLCLKFSMEL